MSSKASILENLVDLKSGTIALFGDVNEQMYAQVLRSLMALHALQTPIEKITFVLNTYGGDLYQALAIYDLIKMQPMTTVVQCNGPVMSAGNVILQAADVRRMTKRSYLMFHFGSQEADSSQCLTHYGEITKDIKEIYKSRTNIPPRIVKTWFEKDTYYNSEEALKYGLIDGIVDYAEKET
jgi:ATP-dependent Clp protease protease subunit